MQVVVPMHICPDSSQITVQQPQPHPPGTYSVMNARCRLVSTISSGRTMLM
jgi:hypothetical protein